MSRVGVWGGKRGPAASARPGAHVHAVKGVRLDAGQLALLLVILVCALQRSARNSVAARGRAQALYGGLYSARNVALSGIHTHSGPGGYLQYVLYTITSLGFVRESFDTLVDGVVEVRASGTPASPAGAEDMFVCRVWPHLYAARRASTCACRRARRVAHHSLSMHRQTPSRLPSLS